MRHLIFLFFTIMMFSIEASAQQKQEPWTYGQLMDPGILAARLDNHKAGELLILSVGPDAIIKGSIDIGAAAEKENIKKLKSQLKNVSKDKEVIIYCGCCPFDKCPNIRPAFMVLTEMGFKNAKLLNLPRNIKVDWLDKDYPVND